MPGGDPTACSQETGGPPNAVSTALEACETAILYGVNFDTNSDVIRPDGQPAIDQIVAAMTEVPDIAVTVEGHTDADGSDESNLDLSDRRAAAVVAALTDAGIDASRLTGLGKGEAEPIADNESSAGKAANRRVEIEPTC